MRRLLRSAPSRNPRRGAVRLVRRRRRSGRRYDLAGRDTLPAVPRSRAPRDQPIDEAGDEPRDDESRGRVAVDDAGLALGLGPELRQKADAGDGNTDERIVEPVADPL